MLLHQRFWRFFFLCFWLFGFFLFYFVSFFLSMHDVKATRQFYGAVTSDLYQPAFTTSSAEWGISWQLYVHIQKTEVHLASHLWPSLEGLKVHKSALNSNVCIDFSVPSALAPHFPPNKVIYLILVNISRICAISSQFSWGSSLCNIWLYICSFLLFLPFSEQTISS